ncbi:response regulator [Caldicellulosiruptoraceae bacterium PP1]
MNILAVDDEVIEVQWLEKVLKEKFDSIFYNIFICSSPQQALEISNSNVIDILVVDMNMPEINGIQLSEKIISKNKKCKILIISGYDDFYYAKKAIELKVHKYLLKPVSEEELIKNINELIIEIKKSKDEEKTKLLTEYIMSDFINLVIKGIINNFTIDDINDYLKINNITWFYSNVGIILLKIDNFYSLVNKYPEYQRNYIIREIKGYIATTLKYFSFDYTFIDDNEVCLIYTNINSQLLNILYNLIQKLYSNKNLSVTAIIGPMVNSGLELKKSYEQVKNYLDIKIFYNKRNIIFTTQNNNIDLKDIKIEIDNILKNINEYFKNKEGIDILIEKLINCFLVINDRYKVINLLNYIIITVYEKLLPYKNKSLELLTDEKILFNNKLTQEEITDKLRTIFYKLYDSLNEEITDYNVTIIKQVENYIEKNIEKRIKLKDIAQHFRFSPNYLSMLFKEVKGENFIEYLHKKKLIYARDLLNNPSLKVYEISDKLGYNNVAHFTKQFKDFFGYTPTEYRKIK